MQALQDWAFFCSFCSHEWAESYRLCLLTFFANFEIKYRPVIANNLAHLCAKLFFQFISCDSPFNGSNAFSCGFRIFKFPKKHMRTRIRQNYVWIWPDPVSAIPGTRQFAEGWGGGAKGGGGLVQGNYWGNIWEPKYWMGGGGLLEDKGGVLEAGKRTFYH